MTSWYMRPYLDLDINHVKLFDYRERGAGFFNLRVLGHSNTSFMASPMVEIGGRTKLDGMSLRSYIAIGASFLHGGDVKTSIKLDEFDIAPFTTTSGMPKTYGNLSAGLELITQQGLELKVEYGLRAAARYLEQTATLRAAMHF